MTKLTPKTYSVIAYFWLASIGRTFTSFTRRYAILLSERKPWKRRNMAWEAYMREEKRFSESPVHHPPTQFFDMEEGIIPFAHKRKPWKKENTYQVILRLENS